MICACVLHPDTVTLLPHVNTTWDGADTVNLLVIDCELPEPHPVCCPQEAVVAVQVTST